MSSSIILKGCSPTFSPRGVARNAEKLQGPCLRPSRGTALQPLRRAVRQSSRRTSLQTTAALQDMPIVKIDTYSNVQNYYGKVLSTSKDLKTSACTAAGQPHPEILRLISKVPTEINDKFYGCGAPIPLGISGRRVLDLGSGSGRDCYIAAALVGETGTVTGVDMTDEQLAVSQKYVDEFCSSLGYSEPNMKFVKGFIEYLDEAGIEDESQDLVISNCVVNLSPDKPRVISEAYRVLAPGGELFFSDVYCDRRLPKEVQEHEVLWGECISGAMYIQDFEREARKVGFTDPRMLSVSRIEVHDPDLQAIVGEAKFYSITYRLFKLPGMLETLCEDYGQYAVYKGTIKGMESGYQLDDHHRFVKNKPLLVCGNTAAMVGEDGLSWLAPHFEVHGDRSVHYGLFDGCGAPMQQADEQSSVGAACC